VGVIRPFSLMYGSFNLSAKFPHSAGVSLPLIFAGLSSRLCLD
jgi:hypothetical protein